MTRMHQTSLRLEPLILDFFAGGGGASAGIHQAVGRGPCVAINHDPAAIAMHAANHPDTLHLRENVWNVHPVRDLPAGDVWFGWFSPSCTHFSRARGGKPLSKQLRSLPWVMARVAKHRRPKVLFLENVPEFQTWGPVREDGSIVEERRGATFRAFVRRLQRLGYVTDWRVLNAADYGAPTFRKRLVMVARRDGQPIVWPEPTHGPGRALPYRTAAECIDWSLPCPSIFGRERPLAEATLRRIAEGIRRYVLGGKPFIVQVNHGRDANRSRTLDEPMPTISTKHGFGLVAPTLIQTGYGERKGQAPRALDIQKPLGTIVAGGSKHALGSALIAKHYGGVVGHEMTRPLGTVTTVDHHSLVACHLTRYNGTGCGSSLDAPMPTVTTKDRFGLVAAFLARFNVVGPCDAVTVDVGGETYAIVDVGLRMLQPRELARAQGFPDDYVLTGSKTDQVCRIGNSVSPPMARAVVAANVGVAKKTRAA